MIRDFKTMALGLLFTWLLLALAAIASGQEQLSIEQNQVKVLTASGAEVVEGFIIVPSDKPLALARSIG